MTNFAQSPDVVGAVGSMNMALHSPIFGKVSNLRIQLKTYFEYNNPRV
jgi:hypothetical protein